MLSDVSYIVIRFCSVPRFSYIVTRFYAFIILNAPRFSLNAYVMKYMNEIIFYWSLLKLKV